MTPQLIMQNQKFETEKWSTGFGTVDPGAGVRLTKDGEWWIFECGCAPMKVMVMVVKVLFDCSWW